MTNHKIMDVPLTDLQISCENPRFEVTQNQREAMKVLIQEQGPKVLALARDIVEVGLNPSEFPIIMANSDDETQFKVLEGNRRITALKLLTTPALSEIMPEKMRNEMDKLRKIFNAEQYKRIRCVIYKNEEDANRWIRLKHTGQNNGIGIVGWDGQASARFNERTGQDASLGSQAIKFLKSILPEDQTNVDLENIALTNLERLLGDPDVRNVIGVDVKDGKLITHLMGCIPEF